MSVRIGIFTDEFLPRESGVTTSILQLRRGLVERGHEVFIIAPGHPEYVDSLPGVVRLPSLDTITLRNIRVAVPLSGSTREIESLRLDIIHSVTQFNVGLYAEFIARRIGRPHITTVHTIMAELVRYYPGQTVAGLLFYGQLYQYYFGKLLKITLPSSDDMQFGLISRQAGIEFIKRQVWMAQNLFLSSMDHVIAPAMHTVQDLRRYGLDVPVTAIPNGIDTDFFRPKPGRRKPDGGVLRIVSVGRLSGEKRQDVLIRAVAATENARLTLIGDGPARSRFERLAQRLGLTDGRVVFCGAQNHEFIKKTFADADIFALASYKFDTQGMVLLEAAAAGLPVVYCDRRLDESVSPAASFYVTHLPAGFAGFFADLASDKRRLAPMRKQALLFAEQHSYDEFARKTEEIYQRASS